MLLNYDTQSKSALKVQVIRSLSLKHWLITHCNKKILKSKFAIKTSLAITTRCNHNIQVLLSKIKDREMKPSKLLANKCCLRFTDESTRPLQSRRRPTLQEVRLKNYFNSVESSSCASCDHVKIYCVQETVTWSYNSLSSNWHLPDKIRLGHLSDPECTPQVKFTT